MVNLGQFIIIDKALSPNNNKSEIESDIWSIERLLYILQPTWTSSPKSKLFQFYFKSYVKGNTSEQDGPSLESSL